jgi:hypothetical protein
MIKLYACVQRLGMMPAERERAVIKLDEIQEIQTRTKVMLMTKKQEQ